MQKIRVFFSWQSERLLPVAEIAGDEQHRLPFEFCRTSQSHFDALLRGTETLDDFNSYLMTFAKPPYRCSR